MRGMALSSPAGSHSKLGEQASIEELIAASQAVSTEGSEEERDYNTLEELAELGEVEV